jgi:superkiller protein 3
MRLCGAFRRGWLFGAGFLVVSILVVSSGTPADAALAPGIRILVVKTEAEARAAAAEVKRGVSFDLLVRERSIGPERERGGYLGRVDTALLSPQARTALAKTARGGLSPIFRTEDGFAIIQVLTPREEQELEARVRREPEAQALLERGTELGQTGDLKAAEALLRQATEMDPGLADAYFNLGIVYRKQQQPDVAIATMRRVVELRPHDFEAHMRLGAWHFEGGQFPESCAAYERAATLQMDSKAVWLKLAQSYEAAGKAAAVVGAYRRVLALSETEDPILIGALLRAAMRAGDGSVAVEAARKLQAFRPGYEGFLRLAEALVLRGDNDAAIQEYQKAAVLAPSSAAAQAGLASVYANTGQSDAAIDRFLQAIRLDPAHPSYYRALARLYKDGGRLDLAIVSLRDGVGAAGSSPALQADMAEELAAVYEAAGMAREATQERLRAASLRNR